MGALIFLALHVAIYFLNFNLILDYVLYWKFDQYSMYVAWTSIGLMQYLDKRIALLWSVVTDTFDVMIMHKFTWAQSKTGFYAGFGLFLDRERISSTMLHLFYDGRGNPLPWYTSFVITIKKKSGASSWNGATIKWGPAGFSIFSTCTLQVIFKIKNDPDGKPIDTSATLAISALRKETLISFQDEVTREFSRHGFPLVPPILSMQVQNRSLSTEFFLEQEAGNAVPLTAVPMDVIGNQDHED